ncbi:MAG: hypothetical protein HKN63_02790 [Rhodobacteraceae bacterium]|nr:hypothetical protein [Paracoccaceae bacterium]
MSDVIQTAKARRTFLMNEIEKRMQEIKKLEEFIKFGQDLARNADSAPKVQIAS